jgi:RimJ/RimL family protein N-acetyltransferase
MRVMAETVCEPIVIRQALPADAPLLGATIATIDAETDFLGKPGEYRHRWADGLAERLRVGAEQGNGAYMMALRDAEIIGFLGAFGGFFERTRGVIYIAHVGLRRAWRGRGIGAKLFIAIEEWARANGAWRLDLRVDEANVPGLALYRKRGFVGEGRIMRAARIGGSWRNHLFMAKTLRPFTEPPWVPLELETETGGIRYEPTLRRPELEDVAALVRFEQKLLGETPFLLKQPHEVADEAATAKRLAEELEQPSRFMLAAFVPNRSGERMIGYVTAWRDVNTRMHHDALVAVNVLREHWGRGIGRMLFARLEDWARAQEKVGRLTGLISAHNARALHFAAALGFAQEVFSPRYAVIDGRAVDRLRVGKLLA